MTTRCKKGFSLIEAAIVLGLVGMVVGGIWMAMASTRASTQANQLQQQTLNLVKSVRDYYAARALPAAGDITSTLRTKGRFPEEMCPANCVSAGSYTVRNAYGGSTTVNIPNVTTYPNQVVVAYYGVDEKGCVQLGMSLSARSAELGLTGYCVTSEGCGGGPEYTTFPIPLATLQSDCRATDNQLDLYFKIRN
jgi:type II secretory pathway pseudopilin PulG